MTERTPPSSPLAPAASPTTSPSKPRRSRSASTYTIPSRPPVSLLNRYHDGGTQTDKRASSSDTSAALTLAETLYSEPLSKTNSRDSVITDRPKQLHAETYNKLMRPATNTAPKTPTAEGGKRRSLIKRLSMQRSVAYDENGDPLPARSDAFRMVDGSIFIDFSPNPRLSIKQFDYFGPLATATAGAVPAGTGRESRVIAGDEAATTDADEDDATKEKPKFEYIEGWKLASVMIALTAASFLILLDNSIVVTAIPRITSDFHSLADIGWYGSAYSLTSGCLQPLTGKLYTYLNAKWTFLAFFVVFEVGSLICGVANSSPLFIAGRVIAGLGASGIQNGSVTILAGSAPLEKRPALMGIMMGFCQIGLVAGPLIGGAFTQFSTWRWCFYINLPVGALTAIFLGIVQVPDYRAQQEVHPGPLTLKKLDLPGFAIFVPFSIMMLLALQWGGNEHAWTSPMILGLLGGAVGNFLIFAAWEYKAGLGAMIPFPVLRKREIWSSCLTCLVLVASVICTAYYLAIYFQTARDASPFQGGIDMLPGILAQLLSAVFAGGFIESAGYYLPFALVGGMLASVGNGLLSTLQPDSATVKWAAFQIVSGFGRGMAFQVPFLATQAHAPPQHLSVAIAMLTFCQTFGTAIFLSISNALFNNKLRAELPVLVPTVNTEDIIHAGAAGVKDVVPAESLPGALLAYTRSYQTVMYLVVALSSVAVIFSLGMGWTDIRPKKPAQGQDNEEKQENAVMQPMEEIAEEDVKEDVREVVRE